MKERLGSGAQLSSLREGHVREQNMKPEPTLSPYLTEIPRI